MRTHTYCRAVPVSLGITCLLVLAACASQADQAPGAVHAAAAATTATTAATGGAAPSTPAGSSPSAAKPVQACTGSQIAIAPALAHTGGVMNQPGGYLTFTNRGSVTCELTSWPTVDGVTQAGKTAPLRHVLSMMWGALETSRAPVVTLAPGDSAYADVGASAIPVGNATSCPAPYTRLEVTIPGGSSATTVSAWLPGADSYLPTCATITGAPADAVSEIVPLSDLAH